MSVWAACGSLDEDRVSDSRTDAASLHCIFPRLKLHDPRSTCQRCGDNMGPIRDSRYGFTVCYC